MTLFFYLAGTYIRTFLTLCGCQLRDMINAVICKVTFLPEPVSRVLGNKRNGNVRRLFLMCHMLHTLGVL